MLKKEHMKYYSVAFLIILIYISYLILKPLLTSILLSAILVYLFFPVHKKLRKLLRNDVASAFIITVIIIAVILLPLAFIANSLTKEAIELTKSGTLQKLKTFTSEKFSGTAIEKLIPQATEGVLEYIKKQASDFIVSLPSKLLLLIISAFMLFYLFLIGESLLESIKATLPTNKKEHLIRHIGDTTYSIIYGLLITAIVQFIFAAIMFTILGVKSPFVFALIIGILGLIPFLGSAIVWVPLAIFSYFTNNPVQAIGIVITGVIISSTEMIIRSKIIGDKAKLHSLTILLGIVGGVQLFGFVGLVIGPIILSSMFIIANEYFRIIKE